MRRLKKQKKSSEDIYYWKELKDKYGTRDKTMAKKIAEDYTKHTRNLTDTEPQIKSYMSKDLKREQLIKILKTHFLDDYGTIELDGLDLTGLAVDLSNLKAERINNSGQIGRKRISNTSQSSEQIINSFQNARRIFNKEQSSEQIIT